MASKARSANVCPVCFETRPLKIVGRCNHSFCTECLSTFLGNQGDDVLSCPTCKVDYPRPWDGVKGLVDYTGEDVKVEDLENVTGRECNQRENLEKTEANKRAVQIPKVLNCTICFHRKKVVRAINLCPECDCLRICKDCTEKHAKSEATRKHVVVQLGDRCDSHPDSLLTKYCSECETAVCVICVMLDHSDHKVEKIHDLLDLKIPELKASLEEKQKMLKELEDQEDNLHWLKVIAPTVDRSATRIKEVQDHAEVCIQNIIKWKNDVMKQIKEDFKVIKDIPADFETVSKDVKHLQELVKRAAGLLAESQHNSAFLDKLVSLQQDIDAVKDVRNVDKAYEEQLRQLREYRFIPRFAKRNAAFGNIDKIKKETHPEKCYQEKVFERTMPVDSEDKFIPCVASIGKKFAVAHPVETGEPSTAIDIYELPGNLTHTLRDNVPPLYDMTATPDGKLAVLSDGAGVRTCSIKLFDPDTGFISTTPDVEDVKPLSLGVTFKHQYVILGDNSQGQKQIVVVNKNGTSEIRHIIDEQEVKKPKVLTCAGKYIFVGGEEHICHFKIKNTTFLSGGICEFMKPAQSVGVTATVWGDLFFTCVQSEIIYLGLWYNDKTTEGKWLKRSQHILSSDASGADREVNISTSDGHIVVSHGQTIQVFNHSTTNANFAQKKKIKKKKKNCQNPAPYEYSHDMV